MARSKRIDDATERVLLAVVNKQDRAAALNELSQAIADEIVNSFSPFSDIELPIIILALRSIERSMTRRFPRQAVMANNLEEHVTVIDMVVPFRTDEP